MPVENSIPKGAYRTRQGDAFDAIAYRLWGDETFAAELMAANPAYLDVLIFPAGVELTVPDVSLAPKAAETLPPWMKR